MRQRIRKLSPRLRMLENLRKRDALCPKPRTEVICRNGVIIERRGTCVGGAAFSPTVPISPKNYYYR